MSMETRDITNGDVESDAQRLMALVEWLNHVVPHFYLSVKASEEELRASLSDGVVLYNIWMKLKPGYVYEGVDYGQSPESRIQRIKRFLAAMAEMGLPCFELSDLEKGSMKPVLDCLFALKEQYMPQSGGLIAKFGEDKRKTLTDTKYLRGLHSPVASGSAAAVLQSGHKFHEVFQMKQGLYSDLPAAKITEMMKSNSFDNAPTQSLLSVVNGILEESIERKNAEIPQRVACLLRKVVQEIERRISTQAEHLRTQNNLFKAREEKYHSRIRVLEALATRTSEESESVLNQLQHIKFEKTKMEDKKNSEDEEFSRLKKEKDQSNLEMLALMKELETTKKTKDESNLEMSALRQELETAKKTKDESNLEMSALMQELETAKKTKDESNLQMSALRQELETAKKTKDESNLEMSTLRQELEAAKKTKDESNLKMSALKQEIETAKKAYELRYQELDAQGKLVQNELEMRLKEQQNLLDDWKNKVKELEVNEESKVQRWSKKEHVFENIMNAHHVALQELRHSLESIKLELLQTQRSYLEELDRFGKKLKGLAEAAQKYHAVLDENRKLYNELQDLKGSIRVYCRIRPFLPGQTKKETVVEEIGENGELVIVNPSKSGKDSQKSFRFNKVFGPTATQAEVFSDTQPLIRTVLDGYNVCIFAYGQTGSGKTHTMTGPEGATKENWGVNYRALDDLFQISEDRKNYFQYEIGVQMIEIYNEQVRDLLSGNSSQKKLGILTTSHAHGLAVPDASMEPVRSTTDVIDLMRMGHENRSVSATAMNERSSRSHSIVTIHVQGTDIKTGASTRGSLHLVDLAGSERVDRSEATGDRLKEAQHINKSLSALGDVIFALAQKSPHVPYRNSKLTQVLQSSLGGRAKTLMFVQVNPDATSYSETLSTLNFAVRVSGVELGAARNNKEGRDVLELMEQVASLKDVIAKKDEEIERLQLKDPKGVQPTVKRSMSSLRYGSVSSPTNPTGDSSQRSPTLSSEKRSGLAQKVAFDQDIRSEYSDIPPDAGSKQFIDDANQQNRILRSSRSMNDMRNKKESPRQSKITKGGTGDSTPADDEDANNEENLSEISDGDVSVGTDTDGATEVNISTKGSTPSKNRDDNLEKSRSVSRIAQRSRIPGQPTSPRLSRVNTTRLATGLRKPASGSSSPVTPGRR
ncbi:hypothetical protein Dimus_027088 [Dionaea muscipula]